MRILRPLLLTAALWVGVAPIALAAPAVNLKAEVYDSDGVVTLGDLFDGAGSAADVRVAAKPGLSVVLDAGAVQQLARRAGLDWANAQGLRRIVVRTGAESGTASAAAARPGNVEVLTYARSLSTGEIVQPEDLIWGKAAAAPSDAAEDAELIIGLAARRPLRAGSVVSARDVTAPQVIAMGRAALGEGFAAQNLTSKRTVQAVATGPGQAAVGPGADQILASPAARYALR
jgi:flagellar basal body P-ring formation protein FlgA